MPSFRCSLTLLCATVLIGVHLPATAAPPSAAPSGASVTVQPGESWPTVRNRMFSLEALKKANPTLDAEMLHPGDIVRAPYVPIAELEREAAARQAAEARLTETRARLAETERDRASLEARRQALVQGERSLGWMRATVIALILVAIALVGILAVVVKATRAARQNAAEVASRHQALQSRYDSLRQSLHEVDVTLQRKVVSLLHLHGGKVVSDTELKSSVGQVLNFTHELKKKHETA
jgi:hypothetical protein